MPIVNLFENLTIDTNWNFKEASEKIKQNDVIEVDIRDKTIGIKDIFTDDTHILIYTKNKLENITKYNQEYSVFRVERHHINDFFIENKRLITLEPSDAYSEETWRRKFSLTNTEFREVLHNLIDNNKLNLKDYEETVVRKFPNKIILSKEK